MSLIISCSQLIPYFSFFCQSFSQMLKIKIKSSFSSIAYPKRYIGQVQIAHQFVGLNPFTQVNDSNVLPRQLIEVFGCES